MGGGIRSETVKAAVGTCSRVGLFDKRLLDVEGVLTSKGIQRRFVEATRRRRVVSVIPEYWLLSGEESPGIVYATQNSKKCNANEVLRNAKGDLRNADGPKSKVKESKYIKNTTYSLSTDVDEEVKAPEADRTPYKEIVELFHSICSSYPTIRSLTDKRKKAIKARLKSYSIDDLKEAFTKAEASAFLKGNNNRNWSADFDWIICEGGGNNIAKILEGKYDDRTPQGSSSGGQKLVIGKYDPEVFNRIVNGGGPDG